jgi:hypothetical protein
MNSVVNEVCVSVAAAFTLSLVPGLHWHRRSFLFGSEPGTELWIFAVLGLIDEIAVSEPGFVNERIVLVCAAGLLSGPWVGTVIGLFVGWLAVAIHSLQLPATMIYLLCGVFSAGVAPSVVPEDCSAPVDGILSGFWDFISAQLVRDLIPCGRICRARDNRGDRHGGHAAGFRHSINLSCYWACA